VYIKFIMHILAVTVRKDRVGVLSRSVFYVTTFGTLHSDSGNLSCWNSSVRTGTRHMSS